MRERRLDAGAMRGSLVLVSGEAGVGKSRLIAEFCATLTYSRWRIGTGTCLEFASRPYGPLLDVLERIDSKPFDFTAAATKHEQFDAIVGRITAISAKTATVVALEDIHWTDAATLDFLTYFGTKVPSMRVLVLVIASYRTQDLHPDNAATLAVERIVRAARAGRIDLSPLRGVELRAFIDDALAAVALPDETRRAIAIAGDGNPFFTEELLKSAAESAATQSEERVRRELPATVRATLLQRLRPFDDDERRVVTQAAVIGRTFALPLLATTLDTEPTLLLPTLRRARLPTHRRVYADDVPLPPRAHARGNLRDVSRCGDRAAPSCDRRRTRRRATRATIDRIARLSLVGGGRWQTRCPIQRDGRR